MVKVIGVRFPSAGKLYYFDPGSLWPSPGDYVIVDTAMGQGLGETVMAVHELDESTLSSPLRPVLRLATEADIRHAEENHAAEAEAFAICQRKIAEHQLDMKLVDAEITFDNSKILFNFTANGRVDFRSLVKDLAAVFHTRIELHQIGARDEAKLLGGLGPCGRPICCASFMGDFQPVSIKMAKEQGLSLNPTKISGICGRLMCCLKYEEDDYEAIHRQMPHIGREVTTPDGVGQVLDTNAIKETVRVRIQKGDSGEIRDYPLTAIQWNSARRWTHPEGEEQPDAPEEAAAVTENVDAEEEHPAPVERKAAGKRDHRRDDRPPRREKHTPKPKPDESAEVTPAAPEPVRRTNSNWRQALNKAKEKAKMGDE